MKLSNVMTLLEAASRIESVVGIVQSANHWLLGLSTANDDRHHKWVFPGGHIKRNESVEKAVVREVYEETHIKCTPNKTQIILPNNHHNKCSSSNNINNNIYKTRSAPW